MAASAGIRVEGARELRATLKKAGDDLNRDALKGARGEVAQLVAQAAKPKAPVVSGKLANSTRGSGTASAAIIRIGRASVPYAGPIVYGWAARNIEPNKYPYEAAEETEPAWSAIYEHAVEGVLNTIRGV